MRYDPPAHMGDVRAAVGGYLSTRCDVSSQHKLPTEEEILATAFASVLGPGRVRLALDQMERHGLIFRYGPYISDRRIDVL